MAKRLISDGISIPALYVHIPFCNAICPFCSFAVLRDDPAKHRLYLDLLKQEYELVSLFQPLDLSRLESIYLGGGTPSRLSMASLNCLVDWINDQLKPTVDAVWAIEVNPEDITRDYAHHLLSLGFSRVSVGVQSFLDSQLTTLKRQHDARQAHRSLEFLLRHTLENLNIDIMFGYPGQTIQSLEKDLTVALSYNPKHISIYSLTIEPKTAFFRRSFWKNWGSENEAVISEMYEWIVAFLASAGYPQYEVSNFCQIGWESSQNLVYWQNENYLGLGLGAHSHLAPYRWGNHRRMVEYRQAIQEKRRPFDFLEIKDAIMERDEDLMLGLRLKKGLDLAGFAAKHQIDFPRGWMAKIELFTQNGMLEESSSHLILSTKGMLLADDISSTLAATLI